MSTSQEVANGILNLLDSEFFADSPNLGEREMRLVRSDFEGIAVNAPAVIDITKRQALPVVVGIGKTTRRQWEVYEPKNLSLVAWDPDTAQVYLSDASPPRVKRPPEEITSRMPPEPDEEPPYAQTASVKMAVRAKDRLELPWAPARLRLAAVHFDWLSNVVPVELRGEREPARGKLRKISPEPNPRAAEAERGLLKKPAIPLPSYEATPLSPKAPPQGLAFTVASKLAASTSLPVYGSFSTQARQWHIDRSGTVHPGAGGRKLKVVAVVPVTLLVFTLDLPLPKRFDWGVPVYAEGPVEAGSTIAGQFAIDALRGGTTRLASGQHTAYVVFDSGIYGPQPFSI